MAQRPTDLLIFFLPGNPGLITYYERYLKSLNHVLRLGSLDGNRIREDYDGFYYYGSSYLGFESPNLKTVLSNVHKQQLQEPMSKSQERRPTRGGPFTLAQQTSFKMKELSWLYENWAPGRSVDVILVGHSVGCYVLLEMCQRIGNINKSPDSKFPLKKPIGGLLLFPLITNLARSPAGGLWHPFLTPGGIRLFQLLITLVFSIMPTSLFGWILQMFFNHSESTVSPGIELLRTQGMVRQALFMAADGYSVITSDKWDSAVWGSSRDPNDGPRLVLIYGWNDAWVSSDSYSYAVSEWMRKDVLGKNWGPYVQRDEVLYPHTFHHFYSEMVAFRSSHFIYERITPPKAPDIIPPIVMEPAAINPRLYQRDFLNIGDEDDDEEEDTDQ